MISRENRDEMIGLIDGGLDGRIKPDALGERVEWLLENTEDQSIKLSYEYLSGWFEEWEDWGDVESDQYGWDVAQRVLLLLHSNEEIACRTFWRWSWRQVMGIGLLVVWCVWAYRYGLSYAMFEMGWMHVVLSAALSGMWSWEYREELALWGGLGYRSRECQPFGSLGEMRRVRREVTAFKKQRYCAEDVPIRRGLSFWMMRYLGYSLVLLLLVAIVLGVIWWSSVVMPALLLITVMPVRAKIYRLISGEDAAMSDECAEMK
ncbi:hypothetical protein KS4_15520 [Poriferisphaera corsica]|uniref:Uncharacterized protein n=1 Tax=Poriferisphaera corsica TaxID=2528020 RepID=A0A517YTK4_9BACT|nr:hypothetical protein [Poriferisphaera corsica]QDU33502.1 hypothetical protein KS4_15520 [Poriferisphaera corsica]